jgi:hypothetical protein
MQRFDWVEGTRAPLAWAHSSVGQPGAHWGGARNEFNAARGNNPPPSAARAPTPGPPGGLFARVEAVRPRSPDAWRARLSSSPLRLLPGRAYTLSLMGRSGGVNGTAEAVLQRLPSNDTVAGARLVLDLDPQWRRFTLRLVEPPSPGDYAFRVECGAKAGWCGGWVGVWEGPEAGARGRGRWAFAWPPAPGPAARQGAPA